MLSDRRKQCAIIPSLTFLGMAAGCAIIQPSSEVTKTKQFSQSGASYYALNFTPAQLDTWNSASAGSRIVPLSWLLALRQPDGIGRFANPEFMAKFGFLYENNSRKYPIGLAIDQQRDVLFDRTGLRWFKNQGGSSDSTAEPWVGLTCAACHTSVITYHNKRIVIPGGSSPLDYLEFITQLNRSIQATYQNQALYEKFAIEVLRDRLNTQNKTMLRKALAKLLRWQLRTEKLNKSPYKHGPGRVDAFGRIVNKVIEATDENPIAGHSSFAPVNYPFLWNAYKQKFVQWNGAARNFVASWDVNAMDDVGALTRNSGAILAAVADIRFLPNNATSGYSRIAVSSLNVRNMKALERLSKRLKAPKWPLMFPKIMSAKHKKGEILYRKYCANCHLLPDSQVRNNPTERVVGLAETVPNNRTDIWSACNYYATNIPTGKMTDIPQSVFVGRRLRGDIPASKLFDTFVVSALAGKLSDFGPELPIQLLKLATNGELTTLLASKNRTDAVPEAKLYERCNSENHTILGYKARPLDGIWATPPFLHNGSVPTLYDLLLPANRRTSSFSFGEWEFDPIKVGLSAKQKYGSKGAKFQTRDKRGTIIPGNGNQGHEYGALEMTDKQRWQMIEYLKSL